MSFTAPFDDFNEGDLVYGVESARRGIHARRWYIDNVFKPNGAATIDEFTPISRGTGKPSDDDQTSFTDAMRGHEKYGAAVNVSMADYIDFSDSEMNSATRKKDKAGLYWATMVADRMVHFVLDGIDLTAVVRKSFAGKNRDHPVGKAGADAQEKNRSITGSELRWIYRNRNLPSVQRYIQFWSGQKQVQPPWVTDPDLWAEYVPTTVNVHHDPDDQTCCCIIQ